MLANMKSAFIGICVTVFTLCGCGSKPAAVLSDSMKDVVAPQSQIVWDIGNKALDEAGKPDASKMTDTDWAQILVAGQKLSELGFATGAAQRVTVTRPGSKLQNEENLGSFSATQVQGFIDSDTPAFASSAKQMAANANEIVAASKARDAEKLVEASSALVEICESCHVTFWYPQHGSGK